VRLTRVAWIAGALDWAYDRFAANRLRFTGRCDATGACSVHAAS
jgi:predicted DCC family thiol-disulfide oxidoreductase YuxK